MFSNVFTLLNRMDGWESSFRNHTFCFTTVKQDVDPQVEIKIYNKKPKPGLRLTES